MRKWLLIVWVLAQGLSAGAQPYGNEWIHYDRQYWMFKVWQDGLRRIDSTALANAGFPMGSVDPRTLQLYVRGQQVPIYVQGEADGVFNNGDFIEFYGAKNDAWLDSTLWDDPAHMNNPYYSLYNDTIRYYLTWGPQQEALRILPSGSSSNWAAYTPLPWCWGKTLVQFVNMYQNGERTGNGASICSMNKGEGYFNSTAFLGTSGQTTTPHSLNVPQLYTGVDAPASNYKVALTSLNNPGGMGQSCPDHHMRLVHGGITHVDTVFQGYKLLKFDLTFPPATVTGASTPINYVVVHDQACPALAPDYVDAFALAWHSITYPRTFAFINVADVELPEGNGIDSTMISFTGVASPVVHAWTPNGILRVSPLQVPGSYKAVLPPHQGRMRMVFATPANVLPVATLQAVNGNGFFNDLAADLPDSAMVIVSHTTLMGAAQQYANYRETNPYNRHNTLLVDVEQLYDQYAYGVRQHPLAIRNYLRMVYDQAPSRPQSLFLLGKSVQAHATGGLSYQKGYRKDALASAACLVPTMGWPSSDLLFGLNLSGTQPAYLSVPVGRLAARNPDDVLHYLAKVASLESQPPAAWMKNILHFRGGMTASQWNQFDNALASFQVVAEDTAFFGHVTKFTKNGTMPIEQAALDSVTTMIENGVTLMTFFAHAYAGGFDISIDSPDNYDWHGKFPVILGNSCYTGNFHQFDGVSASEQFVLHENAGAVAFLSSVDVGLANYLQQYSRDFYKSFSQVNYGKSMGDHIRYAAFNQLSLPGIEPANSAETMALHGDPTLVMNSPPLPDLEVALADLRTIPEQVTADLDSFRLQVVFRNIGKGTHQPFSVALERSLVAEGVLLPAMVQTVSMNTYQDTVEFVIPVHVEGGGTGLNDLHVQLDMDPDVIAELDDLGNNQVTKRIFISSGDLLPVDPYNFAIVPDPSPVLKASTADPFAPVRNYIFQIDTTDLFNSPIMEQHALAAPGGVVEWHPSSIYAINAIQDSVVFFWRCSLDSAGQGGYNWHEYSFQHIAGKQGWGQAHFFQFKDDAFSLMEYDRPDRQFNYQGGTHQIFGEVRGNNYQQCYWRKDTYMQDSPGCGQYPAMAVAVVDPFDFSAWATGYNGVGHLYGQYNENSSCRDRPETVFVFRTQIPANIIPTQMDTMAYMLTHVIPDGHYVLVQTYLRLRRAPLQNSNAMAALAALGAVNLANGTVPDSVPYIFFCRKGDLSSVQEVWGDGPDALINMTANMQLNSRSGAATAPRSHTALAWEGLSWQATPMQPADSLRIQLSGIPQQGGIEQPVLNVGGLAGDVDLQPLLTAQQYPQLRLKGSFWNDAEELPLPAQIRRWQLLGVPAPECAIDPPSGLYVRIDSLFQGQQAEMMVAVRNIGQQPMDSLLMTAWITDRNNQQHRVHYRRNAPLPVGAVLQDTVRFNTQQFPGPNSITIEANPVDTLTGQYDQPEQHHFNNIATLRFLTQQDLENPVLDITFDGIHILDGDIVSARPEIQITLQDENQTLLLDEPGDTIYFKVFLTDPTGTIKRVYFREGGQEVMQFVPANGPSNLSKVFYRPAFGLDGKYRISVRASDKSNNNSGDRDNSVNFEVINRATITEVLNYPNPFTTSTRFVFTITGSEPPTAMRIQIMTITGRVVRELSMADLGPLRVGRNITDFAWDGTDQFGDRLARGVYLYRVAAQLHGQDIEQRDGGAATYFTKGVGKMYLLR
ncbi:MAG TPA: C25 family cysteine peptidase [Flavobacteriales bacterium]|nr:C25 family cysteine peptidase [Flavobacteriales bacterium]